MRGGRGLWAREVPPGPGEIVPAISAAKKAAITVGEGGVYLKKKKKKYGPVKPEGPAPVVRGLWTVQLPKPHTDCPDQRDSKHKKGLQRDSKHKRSLQRD